MTITCNKDNFIKKRDYGIKVARPYYDVRNCADNQLLFNSSWPIILITGVYKEKIVKSTGTIPSGATVVSNQTENFDICATNETYVYTKRVVTTYNNNGTIGSVTNTYGHEHYETHPILAFSSSALSNLSGYVVCTNIDLSTDVDYPYTSAPLEYFGGDLDYGIKTRAYYVHDMPKYNEIFGCGINSRLSSKIVQAVKTTESYENGQSFVAWKPPKINENGTFPVTDYECYSFYTAQTGLNNDALYPTNTRYDTAENCAYILPLADTLTDERMLILRSPMVAPTNVEVTYNGS